LSLVSIFIIVLVLLEQTPFLEGVSSLSGDVRKVVPAAYMLQEELTQLYNCHSKSKLRKPYFHKLKNYEVTDKISYIDWISEQNYITSQFSGLLTQFNMSISHKRDYPSVYVQIEKAVKPVMLDWLISQHDHILQWTRRAFEIEVIYSWQNIHMLISVDSR